jgi:hypothetical protein
MSKLFTLLLNDRLTLFCDSMGLISDNQIGFRKGFRTSDHVFTLKTLVDQAFSENKKLYTCFVDFRKAYDTVWRKGLFLKLLNSGISVNFVKLIRDMYSRLQACICLPNGLSLPFPSLVGLKQGCNLSPMLFNLFVNDFIDNFNYEKCDSPLLENLKVGCLFYADDLVLISESKEGLQESLNDLHNFTKQWHLEINTIKTKCLVFSRGRKKDIPDTFTLGEILLTQCDSYCYLGVIFTRSGSMKTAAQALIDKAYSAMFSILRNINKHRTVRIELLLDLFDKMVLPIALYNSEVWGTNLIPTNPRNNEFFSDKYLAKLSLQILQNKFVKMALGLPPKASNWATLSEVGRYPVVIKAFIAMIKYLFHLDSSPSVILSAALTTNIGLSRGGYNCWFKGIQRILKFCSLDYLLYTSDAREIGCQLKSLKKRFEALFLEHWKKERVNFQKDSKLELFTTLKENFGISDYLSERIIFPHRSALTKMRISAHKYPIETGRYFGITREERLCPFGCNTIGDEQHYLLQCSHPFLSEIRTPLIEAISTQNPQFEMMNKNEQCHFLLGNRDPRTLAISAKLCYKTQIVFREITS